MPMPPRRAIIVCPGGGYGGTSDREGEPVALQYFAAGLNAFVLRYSVLPHAADYTPLTEAALAIAHVKLNAEKYSIDSSYVFITGFSAGGHLAASAGTLWKLPLLCDRIRAELGEDYRDGIHRPTATLPCYPVITAGDFAHKDSFVALLGDHPDETTLNQVSLEHKVTKDTPPTFLWHTFEDATVPMENSLLFVSAMKKANVPCEFHLFPHGEHGLSLATEQTASPDGRFLSATCSQWINLAKTWMENL
jgi:acetyl esterase/lipase